MWTTGGVGGGWAQLQAGGGAVTATGAETVA